VSWTPPGTVTAGLEGDFLHVIAFPPAASPWPGSRVSPSTNRAAAPAGPGEGDRRDPARGRYDSDRYALVGAGMAYLATDGSARIWSREGRPPEILTDSLAPIVALGARGERLYLLSAKALLVQRVLSDARSERTARLTLGRDHARRGCGGRDRVWLVGARAPPTSTIGCRAMGPGCLHLAGRAGAQSLELDNARLLGGHLAVPVLSEVIKLSEQGDPVEDPQTGQFRPAERLRVDRARLDGWRVLSVGGRSG